MQRIVINRCFGGFGLSDEAMHHYLKLKGINYGTSPEKSPFSKTCKTLFWREDTDQQSRDLLWDRDIARDDEALIQTIEALGDKASGDFADLKIVDVPDDVKWHIAEYDGYEHVAEDHRTWS